MNYLSHYYIDRFHPSPYFKLGVIFPDLYRNFNAELRRQVFSQGIVWNSEQQLLIDGVKKHYHIDSIFHNLPEFKHWTQLLEKKMDKAMLKGKYERRFFLAHIWVEFILDRLLIMQEPGLPEMFYTDMEQIDEGVINDFFARMNKPEQGTLFFSRFRMMLGNQYLFSYINNETFMGALLNLYQRTVGSVVPQGDKPELMEISLEAEEMISPRITGLFAHLTN